jgi:hypothetical protein
MDLCDKHKEFPKHFLVQHRDLVLYDIFHQIKALFLYPLNCGCIENCTCKAIREKIVFSLNIDFYNKARMKGDNPDYLHAMRYFYKIPDDAYFRESYGDGYPLWLIEEKFREKSNQNHFKIVGHLTWTLLRLARTYEISPIDRLPLASLTEALDIILGKTPLKSKSRTEHNETYLGGEKKYIYFFNAYKPICHFIAAYQHSAKENPSFSFADPKHIQEFLEQSYWIRQKLLLIQTPNAKQKCLFTEDSLIPVRPWVKLDNSSFPLEPFQDKLDEINEFIKNSPLKSSSASPTGAKFLRR